MATLFNITHEDNNLSEYDTVQTDGGDLATGAPGLADTSYKAEATIDDANAIWGEKNFSLAADDFRFRYYWDPNGLNMGASEEFQNLNVYDSTGGVGDWLVQMWLKHDGSNYQLQVGRRDDGGGTAFSNYYDISDDPHYVEVYAERATGAAGNDGQVRLWIDGVLKATLSSIDNWDIFQTMNRFRIGALSGIDWPGTNGTFFFDQIKANDDGSEIGAHIPEGGAPVIITGPEAPPRPSLVVYDLEGRGRRLERALRRRWSSHYGPDGSGFGYLMFSLDRRLGFDYRDIGYNYRVQLREGLATVLFDGLIKKIAEDQADPDRLEVTALGWNVVAGDDAFNWVFCDMRYMMWKGSETPSGSFCPDKFDYDLQDHLQFKPRRGVDYEANDYTRLRYTLQFGEVAERIKFDWDVALPDAWPGKLEIRDSNGVILWSRNTTGNGTGQNFATTGSPTYIEIRFYVTTAGENTAEDGTVYGRLTNVKVYGVEDTTVDAGVIAKKVLSALSQSYHGLSTSIARIASPGRALDAASAFDTDMSPEQIMSHICKFGDASGNPLAWGVDMDDQRRLFLETMDLTTIRYVVLRESALQAQVSGDAQESWQKVYGVWTDQVGEVQRSADRVDQDAIDALGGYVRRRALNIDGATEEAQVLQAVDLYLAENAMPKVTSSFTVRGNIYTPALNPVPFDEIRAGGMVQVRDFRAREATLSPNDFRDMWTTFQLVGVEVDEDAHTVRLIPAGDLAGFEQYMAILAQLREG